jgi:hypothetical protein
MNGAGFYEASMDAPMDWSGGVINSIHPSSRVAFTEALSEVRAAGIDGPVSEVLAKKVLATGQPASVLIRCAGLEAARERWSQAHRERQADRIEGLGPRAAQLAGWLREVRA